MKRMWREQAVRQATSYREANTIYGALAGCGLSSNIYYAVLDCIVESGRGKNKRTALPHFVTPILHTDNLYRRAI